MKKLLEISNPPNGMNPSQLFNSQEHLDNWLIENNDKIINPILTDTELTFDGGSATITEVADDFQN